MTDTITPPALDEWCVVELLGHRRLAAHVTEVTIAGQGMLRLDEPATATTKARTQYVNPSSIYALHPTTEEVVRAMAAQWASEPVSRYELARALPAAPSPERVPWEPDDTPDDDPGDPDDDALDTDPRDHYNPDHP